MTEAERQAIRELAQVGNIGGLVELIRRIDAKDTEYRDTTEMPEPWGPQPAEKPLEWICEGPTGIVVSMKSVQ